MNDQTPGLLVWDKPPQERPTSEHNQMYGADDAPPGAYVPNMPREWQETWKAKMAGQRSEGLAGLRVEIRRVFRGAAYRYAQMVIKVYHSGKVLMSMNGTAELTAGQAAELPRAIEEARAAMRAHAQEAGAFEPMLTSDGHCPEGDPCKHSYSHLDGKPRSTR